MKTTPYPYPLVLDHCQPAPGSTWSYARYQQDAGPVPAALAASLRTTASVPIHAASEQSAESIDFHNLAHDEDGDQSPALGKSITKQPRALHHTTPTSAKCHAPLAPTSLCHRVPTGALLTISSKDIASVCDVEGNNVGRNRAEKIQHQYNIAVQGVQQIATFLHASNATSFPPAITDIDALFLGTLLKETPAIDATKLAAVPSEATTAPTVGAVSTDASVDPTGAMDSATADTPDSAAVATEFVIDLDTLNAIDNLGATR
ncbi:hypothetical protein DFJ73DRAFT_780401 [Zopfochytrium polystomum]|nr:hypothetical protein DFJ73DRAFT_780401 [Zopfochytrium polystomum]